MPRYLFNPATNYGSSGGGITPVLLGGTGASTADGAATNLGFIKSSLLGVANGVASLDANSKLVAQLDWAKVSSGKPTTLSGYGITDAVALSAVGAANGVGGLDSSGKLPLAQIPSGLGASITGPTSVYVGQVVNYTINAFSSFATYTITAVGGTFTRTNENITFTTTASAGGAASITINGAVHTLTVLASSVVAPSITSPANAATGISLVPTFTSSAFAYLGLTQTQDSVRWEISTSSGFGTTVQTYEGASNLTSWTPTSLSVNTTYYVRVKHHSSLGGWSNWSGVVSFSTITSYGWVARLGGNGTADVFTGVVMDSSGNIYAVGNENSTDGNLDLLLTKWDASGNLVWQRKIFGIKQYTYSLTIDASDNIYTAGCQRNDNNSNKAYITKWTTAGNLVWQRSINDGTNASEFHAITTDASGNIYAGGMHYDVSIGGYWVGLFTKWDASGNLTWQKKFGAISNVQNYIHGVTFDASSGNIYTVGNNGNGNSMIIKWDTSGNIVWQRRATLGSNEQCRTVTCDSNGYVYVGMYLYSGDHSASLLKLDSSGNLVWQRAMYLGVDSVFKSVKLDTSGNIYAVGYCVNYAIITKWDTSGNLTWKKKINTSYNNNYLYGVIVDSLSNIYAVGAMNNGAGGDHDCIISKWSSDSSSVPNGALTGTGMTTLSIGDPGVSSTTVTPTMATTSYSVSNSTLTTNIPTMSQATPALTRYFSTY